MAKKVLLENAQGAQLIETRFHEHEDLVEKVVSQADPHFQIEPTIFVFGKEGRQHRDVQFRSDESAGYHYSQQVMEAEPLTTEMTKLVAIVNREFGAEYNGILINRYVDGTKTVGSHADSEVELNAHAGVVSISYGATRTFRVRDAKTKRIVGDYPARHLMALQMKGPFQLHYKHEIPQEKRISGCRISLTFRQHDPAKEAPLRSRTSAKRKRECARQIGA